MANEDIMHLSRPESRRGRMSMKERAKIFSPFAALKGYEEAVEAKNCSRCNRILLTEEEENEVDKLLCRVQKGSRVRMYRFRLDPGPDGMGGFAEGRYEAVEGTVERIEPAFGFLRLKTGPAPAEEIGFQDIRTLRILSEEEGPEEALPDYSD